MSTSFGRLFEILRRAAAHLREATGEDPFLSREDFRRKLNTVDLSERPLLESLYHFVLAQENSPRSRITEKDIDQALERALSQVITAYQLAPGPLSPEAEEELQSYGDAHLELGKNLKAAAQQAAPIPPAELVNKLESLAEALEPVNYHSGEYSPFKGIYLPSRLEELTPAIFREALEQFLREFGDGDFRVERLIRAESYFPDFINRQPSAERQALAREVVELFRQQLHQLSVAILESQRYGWRPMFIVGLNPAGNLVGLQCNVLWE